MATIFYGRLASIIVCTKEMELRAERSGRAISELTPLFGSARFIVNAVQMGNGIYVVDKTNGCEKSSRLTGKTVTEERLILEVSTNIDTSLVEPGLSHYGLENCPLIEEHSHFSGLSIKTLYALSLKEPPYTKKNHYSKVLPQEEGKTGSLLTGFLKSSAENVGVEPLSHEDEEGFLSMVAAALTPFEIMAKVCPIIPQGRVDIAPVAIINI